MSIIKSQKYNISGRKFKGKLEQKWETTIARKYSPYHEDKKEKPDFTTDFTFVIYKLMENFDVTAIDARKRRPIIIDDTGDSNDHLFGIEDYLFDQENVEYLENEDQRLILEYMIDIGIINNVYKERDLQEEINRLRRRMANITTILKREGLSSRKKADLKQKKEEFEKEIKELRMIVLDSKNSVFPRNPGTKWENIKITLIDNDTVRIETPSGKSKFSYHELGMSDKRSANKPTMLWGLLKIFAQHQGVIKPFNTSYDPKIPDTAKRLNKHLQTIFNIQESIFTDHYKAEKGYRARIFFSDQTQVIQ